MTKILNNDTKTRQTPSFKGLKHNNTNFLSHKYDNVRFTSNNIKKAKSSKSDNIWKWAAGLGGAALVTVGLFFAVKKGKDPQLDKMETVIPELEKIIGTDIPKLEEIETAIPKEEMETVIPELVKNLGEKYEDVFVSFGHGSTHKISEELEKLITHRDSLEGREGIINTTYEIMGKYSINGEYEKAIKEAKKALEFLDKFAAKELVPTEGSFRKPEQIINEKCNVLMNMSHYYKDLGRPDKEIEMLRQGLELNPKHLNLVRFLVGALCKYNKPEEGIKYCKEMLKGCKDSFYTEYVKNMAECLKKMEQNEKATELQIISDKAKTRNWPLISDEKEIFDKLPRALKDKLNAGGEGVREAVTDHVMKTLKDLNLG